MELIFYKIQNWAKLRTRNELILIYIAVSFPFIFTGLNSIEVDDNVLIFWTIDIFLYLIVPITGVYYMIKMNLVTWSALGLTINKYNRKRVIEYSILLFFFSLPIYVHINYFFHSIIPADLQTWEGSGYVYMYPNKGIMKFIAIFYISITAGLVEEIYHRGLFRLFFQSGRNNNIKYVLYSSLIFTLLHLGYDIVGLLTVFVYGIINALIYLRLRNLWPLIISHFWIDFCIISFY